MKVKIPAKIALPIIIIIFLKSLSLTVLISISSEETKFSKMVIESPIKLGVIIAKILAIMAVSYTHLTLPTILLV